MGSILALKRKLQHELQAHLRMQHQLLSRTTCRDCNSVLAEASLVLFSIRTELNQVVLPAVERLHTSKEIDISAAGGPGLLRRAQALVMAKSEVVDGPGPVLVEGETIVEEGEGEGEDEDKVEEDKVVCVPIA